LKEIANTTFDLNVDSRSRRSEYITARAICYKILKEHCDMSYTFIGRQFNKNHATILHAIDEFPWMLKADREMEKNYRKILNKWLIKSEDCTDTNPSLLKKDLLKLEERNNLLNLALIEMKEQVDKLMKQSASLRKFEKSLPEERLNRIEKKLSDIVNGII
tara:strand:+ start:678 stop:1160 length:483 start_codon:yes stop_codon:yes gene_type:complete